MIELFYAYSSILPLVGVLSAIIFIISLLSLPWLAAKIPEDYFLYDQRSSVLWKKKTSPVFHLLLTVVKNVLGIILLLGGILMLFIPGQGLLTIFMGLVLIDYPKKYILERKLVKTPVVLKGINWLRKKANKPPLNVGS